MSSTKNKNTRMIVGSPEWTESKRVPPTKYHSIYECDAKHIPKHFIKASPTMTHYNNLQQNMMDNGWKLCQGDEGEADYFIHPTYTDTKFTAYTCYINGNKFIIPVSSFEKDKKGLACSFIVHPGTTNLTIRSNKWNSYWNTRKGKRKAKYYKYLDARQQKKKEIEEEEAEFKKNMKKNNQI